MSNASDSETRDKARRFFDLANPTKFLAMADRIRFQALNLFNSSFIVQQSEILAQRLHREAGAEPDAQVKLAFRLFYAREPDAFELSNSIAMLREHGAVAFARAMFNTSEFLFVQ